MVFVVVYVFLVGYLARGFPLAAISRRAQAASRSRPSASGGGPRRAALAWPFASAQAGKHGGNHPCRFPPPSSPFPSVVPRARSQRRAAAVVRADGRAGVSLRRARSGRGARRGRGWGRAGSAWAALSWFLTVDPRCLSPMSSTRQLTLSFLSADWTGILHRLGSTSGNPGQVGWIQAACWIASN